VVLWFGRDRSPFFWSDIGHMLRKRPPMSSKILGSVLPLAKGHVRGRLHNAGATLFRVLKMMIDIRDSDVNVLGDLSALGRSKWSTLPAQHDGALTNGKLCVADDAVPFRTKAF
jgi:hypothetical protein